MDRRRGLKERLHRARQPLGERLLRELHARLRDELLNGEIFYTLAEAKAVLSLLILSTNAALSLDAAEKSSVSSSGSFIQDSEPCGTADDLHFCGVLTSKGPPSITIPAMRAAGRGQRSAEDLFGRSASRQ